MLLFSFMKMLNVIYKHFILIIIKVALNDLVLSIASQRRARHSSRDREGSHCWRSCAQTKWGVGIQSSSDRSLWGSSPLSVLSSASSSPPSSLFSVTVSTYFLAAALPPLICIQFKSHEPRDYSSRWLFNEMNSHLISFYRQTRKLCRVWRLSAVTQSATLETRKWREKLAFAKIHSCIGQKIKGKFVRNAVVICP